MPRPCAFALVLCLVVVAAACGSTANTYRSQIDKVQKGFEPRLSPIEQQLSIAIRDRRTADAADLAGRAATLLGTAADDVTAVDPPAQLQARAASLVQAYRTLVRSLRALETALRRKQAKPINAAISSYNDARLHETSAVAALNAG